MYALCNAILVINSSLIELIPFSYKLCFLDGCRHSYILILYFYCYVISYLTKYVNIIIINIPVNLNPFFVLEKRRSRKNHLKQLWYFNFSFPLTEFSQIIIGYNNIIY